MDNGVGTLFRSNELLPKAFAQQNFMEKILIHLGVGRLAGVGWQAQSEGGAFSIFAAGVNATAMMVHNKIARHQMDAVFHRGITPYHKRIKNQTQGFLRQTRAIVADLALRYSADAARVETDVLALLAQLHERGVLEYE